SIDESETSSIPTFNLSVPTSLSGVESHLLDPRNTYEDAAQWQEKADKLATLFVENFVQYTDTDSGRDLVSAGPSI
ncbi:MAG: phosphoenolpyruvate carboxykinase (ATP), partial [bacterium]